ncbi:MAG: nuclear transport factor 2 family protein [Deltaproteobacteria bacterium]|nr:nuclear transport factor 2 family protein [Deltaproteobacteria bacterium]
MPEAIDYFLIQNLLNRYSDAVDRGDFDAVGAMFRDADVYFPGDEKPSIQSGTGDFGLRARVDARLPGNRQSAHATSVHQPDHRFR